ncbi:MAG: RnfABCDGE type electron transport complex subunit B [Legionellales bacterium]
MISVKEIDALLPQTQCGECGYPGCLPYAEALAQGKAPVNKCPPGGVTVVQALADLLQIDATAYLQDAKNNTRLPSVAIIREAECIGCTKCIKACPVDAIIGSGKLMHAVITHECTGCGLCVEPCPVDCIEMVTQPLATYDQNLARKRFNAKQTRQLRDEHEKQLAYREKRQLALQSADQTQDIQAKQSYIQLALTRVKDRINQ